MPNELVAVEPRVETLPIQVEGDAADDPAIWVAPGDGSGSLVLATQTQGVLHVYDLDGNLRNSFPAGRVNNVDLQRAFPMPTGAAIALVAASNQSFNGISLFRLDTTSGALTDIGAAHERVELTEIYGLCMASDPRTDRTYIYVNSKDGVIHQYLARGRIDGKVELERMRVLELATQVEGCTVDAVAGALYVGEETRGLWRFDAWPDGSATPSLVVAVGNHGIVADIEGVDVAHGPGDGFLVLSSQGNSTFAVLDRLPPHGYRGSFEIVRGAGIDGAQDTDGLAIITTPVGPFAGGLLVVQDGINTLPRGNQNFKYVPWDDVVVALDLN
ncbi:MAG: phytase [Pseudomonadota bacterium]